ncbi:MAG: hypothetical protein ABIP12_02030 [Terriglobales bacterium]
MLTFIFHGETLAKDLLILGTIAMLGLMVFCIGLVRLIFWYKERKKRQNHAPLVD